jgi:hypothetical protein
MTAHIGAKSIDGSLISQADVARMEAEEALHGAWQRKAARVVASCSRSVEDCRDLLSMLGLDADVVAGARREDGAKPVRKRRPTAA